MLSVVSLNDALHYHAVHFSMKILVKAGIRQSQRIMLVNVSQYQFLLTEVKMTSHAY